MPIRYTPRRRSRTCYLHSLPTPYAYRSRTHASLDIHTCTHIRHSITDSVWRRWRCGRRAAGAADPLLKQGSPPAAFLLQCHLAVRSPISPPPRHHLATTSQCISPPSRHAPRRELRASARLGGRSEVVGLDLATQVPRGAREEEDVHLLGLGAGCG